MRAEVSTVCLHDDETTYDVAEVTEKYKSDNEMIKERLDHQLLTPRHREQVNNIAILETRYQEEIALKKSGIAKKKIRDRARSAMEVGNFPRPSDLC